MTVNLEQLQKSLTPVSKTYLKADKWVEEASSGVMETMTSTQLKKFLKNARTYIEEFSKYQGVNEFENLIEINTGHCGRRVL